MALNRFSSLPDQKVMNTYVGIPYEELMKQGLIKQHNYDLGVAEKQSFLESKAGVKFREEDRAAFQEINKRYEDELNKVVEAAHNDYSSSAWKEGYNNLKRKLSADMSQGDLYAMQHNYNVFQEWNKQKKDFKESAYKPFLDNSYQSVGRYQGYKKDDGSYNLTSVDNIDKYLDRDKKADDIVKGIAANGWGGYKLGADQYGNTVIMNSKGESVSPDKIKGTFLNLFGQSEEFKQLQREAIFAAQETGVNPNKYLNESINALLEGVTQKYGYKKTDADVKFHDLQEWQNKNENDNSTHDFEETAGVEYKPSTIDPKYLTKQGKNNTYYTYSPGNGGAITPSGKQVYKEMPAEEKIKYEKILKTLAPDVDPKSDKAYEIVKNYVKTVEENKFVDKTPIITGDFIRRGEKGRSTREDATKDLLANYKYRTFYNVKTGEKVSGSDEDFLEKMGYTGKDAREKFEKEFTVTGEYSPKNRFPAVTKSEAFVDPVAVTIGNGEFAVSRSKGELSGDQFRTHKLINSVYNAFNELPGIDNQVVLEGVNFKTTVDKETGLKMLIDPDGDTIKFDNFEDLPQVLHAHYENK